MTTILEKRFPANYQFHQFHFITKIMYKKIISDNNVQNEIISNMTAFYYISARQKQKVRKTAKYLKHVATIPTQLILCRSDAHVIYKYFLRLS